MGTLGDLYNKFHRSLRNRDRLVDLTDVRDWAEEAEEEIAMRYGHKGEQVYTGVEEDEKEDLPSDCLHVDEVREYDEDDNWEFYTDYQVTVDGEIIFRTVNEDGKFKIIYTKTVGDLTATSTEDLNVHAVFHKPILDYCLYRYHAMDSGADGNENSYGMGFYNRFIEGITRASDKLTDRTVRTRRIRPKGFYHY